MAFRSSAIASSASGGNLTATPAGVAAHDRLLAIWWADGSAEAPSTPSGWTLLNNASGGIDGQAFRLYEKKDATGSDTFTFTYAGGSPVALICAAWSGRDNSAAATVVLTPFTGTSLFPVAISLTGVTAAQDDDIAVFAVTDQVSGGSRFVFNTITSYTERQDGVAVDWVSGGTLQTRDAVSAGATGSLSTTAVSGTDNADVAGFVIALAIAAAGDTLQPQSCL